MNSVVENLNIQAHIGAEMNNANGTLLMRIANMCSWMEPNAFNLRINPMVTEKEKREFKLREEMLYRMMD
jgi:hypothetical protein